MHCAISITILQIRTYTFIEFRFNTFKICD